MSENVADWGATGYCSAEYARCLSHLGEVESLQRSGGWCIRRHIAGSELVDAMGPYPLLCCQDWGGLGEDLTSLSSRIVSFSCVIDPLADVSERALVRCFPDRMIRFKTHYIVDLSLSLESFVSEHHRRDGRRGLRRVETERYTDPLEHADAWVDLYKENVVGRHAVTGPAAFPSTSLAAQLAVPGAVAFAARRDDTVVGMQLWYVEQGKAYYHLAAYSDVGYREGASYALMWQVLAHMQDIGVRFANLGGGAGMRTGEGDGLSRFKAGWSNMQRTAYFGGRILDRAAYERLCLQSPGNSREYFPAYRLP